MEDGKTLRSRRDHLVSISEQLENERKTRFMTVFEHVNNNFSRVYEILQPSGSGKLRLENSKNPFEGGLEMACVPPGKSRNTREIRPLRRREVHGCPRIDFCNSGL